MGAVLRREWGAYFHSAIGYVFLAVFYLFSGFFFFLYCLSAHSTDMSGVFSSLFVVLLFLIPVLTMKLLSEEKKMKTDQALLTAPVSLYGVVTGKFLAAFLLFCTAVASTAVYALILSIFAEVDWVVVIGNIVGILLLGMAMISIGLFISGLTENQVIAAVGSFAILLLLMLTDSLAAVLPDFLSFLGTVLEQLSFNGRYAGFTMGLFDISDALFFISVTAVFLFLTVRTLEKRRWA